MTDRQALIAKKLQRLSVKRMLEKLSGIEVIAILESGEHTALEDMYLAYVPIMCSLATLPYSKISYQSTKEQVISWIVVNMELKEKEEYFFYCHGTWVKIRISDLYRGIKSLWEHPGGGFLLVDNHLTRIMEVSFDSRDENNYLLDIWNYNNAGNIGDSQERKHENLE